MNFYEAMLRKRKKKKKKDVHCELLWAEVKKIKLFK